MSTDVMQILIDGKEVAHNQFRINSDVKCKEITFKFSPDAKDGKYQGFLRLVDHQLDRIDSQELKSGQQVDVLQWTLFYDKKWNPLACFLLCLLAAIVASLCLWFFVLKKSFFPTIKVAKMRITEPYYSEFTIKGTRRVVLTNHPLKQSTVNRLFTGRILYVVHPCWTFPVALESSKRQVKISPSTALTIEPPAFTLMKQVEYTLRYVDANDDKHVITVY